MICLDKFSKEKKRRIFDKNFFHLYSESNNVSNRLRKYGFMLDSIPDNVIKSLNGIVNSINKKPYDYVKINDLLAGEIEKEYQCKFDDTFLSYLDDLLKYYEVRSNGFIKSYLDQTPDERLDNLLEKIRIDSINKNIKKNFINIDYTPKLKIDDRDQWVNFQKKYEFNPEHSHSGILSFVIWHDIPFYMEDELDKSPSQKTKLDNRESGYFKFTPQYGEPLSHSSKKVLIAADKRFNGTICIFPSVLTHSVYPFYSSDDYRISFSGNLKFENFGKSLDEYIEKIKNYNNIV